MLDAEAGVFGQKTLSALLRKDDLPESFGAYGDAGWYQKELPCHLAP